MTAVLAGFLIIGVALPVLPLHVTNDLGFGPLVVGLVAGAQFAAALLSRIWAGSYSDRRGAKRSVFVGLLAAGAAGLLYLLSLVFLKAPTGFCCDSARRSCGSRRRRELHYHRWHRLGDGSR